MSLAVDIMKKYKSFSLDMKFDTGGQPTGLLGASGCGKSLTLKCIAGIETPDQGRIVLNGRVLYDSGKGINLLPRERHIGFMFQNYALFPNMTVGENIAIAIRDRKKRKPVTERMLEMFRLTGLYSSYPHQLSGGEQQRVALARILAYEPEMLMLDEPFSALDSFLKEQLQQELAEVLREFKGDILMVSHSRDELYHFCETIAVIYKGRILELGSKAGVFSNPEAVVTAKLTGCKNISRARKISDREVMALDWNISLRTDRQVEDDIRYVGIRAHNIRRALGPEEENLLKIGISGIYERPFENIVILYNGEYSPEDGRLWWIMPKQDWMEICREGKPGYISLPKEHILLLKDRKEYPV